MTTTIKVNEVTREVPEPSYDGRNGFPTRSETVFEVVETTKVFDDEEVSRVLASCPEKKFADRIALALRYPPVAYNGTR